MVVGEDGVGRALVPRAAERFACLGIPDRTPCIDPQSGDEQLLNRFFADLWVLGGLAENTVRSYARDVVVWARFLRDARGKSWLEADRSDLLAFHKLRRHTGVPGWAGATRTISGRSWDRAVCALAKLYDWAGLHELIDRAPFISSGANVAAIEEHARWGRRATRRFGREGAPQSRHAMVLLDEEQYRLWRDAGVRGMAAGTTALPAYRGRNSERNARFCDTLVTTGARVSELAAMVVQELPSLDGPAEGRGPLVELGFAASVTKGGRGRRVPVATSVVARLWEYVRWDREQRVRAARARGDYERLLQGGQALACRNLTATGCQVQEGDGSWGQRRWSGLDASGRRRLVEVDGSGQAIGPVMLWLAEGGEPAALKSWQTMFRRASERCAAAGVSLEVSPHVLRHSYATRVLSALIAAQLDTGNVAEAFGGIPETRYRKVFGDPLRTLQRWLGHQSITSTFIYLDNIAELRDFHARSVQEVFDAFVGDLAARQPAPEGRKR
ncbi:MAG: site-specific integrase [Actinomycetota bacterium]|nr:site-specific integrase [Actinomycetota bacterium]